MARSRRLLAYTVVTLDYRWLFGTQLQVQFKTRINGCESLLVAVPVYLPVSVPDASVCTTYAGDSGACSIRALSMVEMPAIQITQSEMREVEIAHIPRAGFRSVAIHALTKEGQLEPETAAVRRFDITGVIPPLGLVIGMVEMIVRKFVAIPRQRNAVLRAGCGLPRERQFRLHHEQQSHEPCDRATPHAHSRLG